MSETKAKLQAKINELEEKIKSQENQLFFITQRHNEDTKKKQDALLKVSNYLELVTSENKSLRATINYLENKEKIEELYGARTFTTVTEIKKLEFSKLRKVVSGVEHNYLVAESVDGLYVIEEFIGYSVVYKKTPINFLYSESIIDENSFMVGRYSDVNKSATEWAIDSCNRIHIKVVSEILEKFAIITVKE